MTKEERVLKLHEKMAVRKQKKENARTWAAGAGSLALLACLIALIGSSGPAHLGATAGLYSGATLLFEGAGDYVSRRRSTPIFVRTRPPRKPAPAVT